MKILKMPSLFNILVLNFNIIKGNVRNVQIIVRNVKIPIYVLNVRTLSILKKLPQKLVYNKAK